MSEANTFEKNLGRLESIVEKLEQEDLGIEETLKLFQEGMKLGKDCRKQLEGIELQVKKVIGEGNDGEPVVDDGDGV